MASEQASERWGFETRAIHAGQHPDPTTGAVVPPISLSTTFAQDGVGDHKGYEYSRSGNPTRTALEQCVASLEGAAHGLSFASGLAAEDAVLRLLRPGDHLLLGNDAYGGTFRLISSVFGAWGITFTPVDLTDLESTHAAIQPNTRMIWLETPTNPMLTVIDIAGVSAIARKAGALCVVDNTFATPHLQQPLAHGADVVVHSVTKYLGGHSDVVGGFLATSDDSIAERLRYIQNAAGAVPSPFDCYLTLRGVRTLSVRVERACDNAETIVALLADHPSVSTVYYPGLSTHPGHAAATRQMGRFGAMVSFVMSGGAVAARAIAEATELFTLAESLGAVESLIEVPAAMTHMSTAGSPLEVDAGLVRLSVGIETTADLVSDLRQALAHA